jgi:hypothetical protein
MTAEMKRRLHIMNRYEITSFRPAFAKDIDYTGNGIMFSYLDPQLIEQAKEDHNGNAPEDIIISLTDSRITLYLAYPLTEDEEPESVFFVLSSLAGLEFAWWAAREVYELSGEDAQQYVQRLFLQLAYEPTESGGIALDWLNGEQRKLVYKAYISSKATVSA